MTLEKYEDFPMNGVKELTDYLAFRGLETSGKKSWISCKSIFILRVKTGDSGVFRRIKLKELNMNMEILSNAFLSSKVRASQAVQEQKQISILLRKLMKMGEVSCQLGALYGTLLQNLQPCYYYPI